MKQISIVLLSLFITFLPGLSFSAGPILVPAWQTEAVFEQAESVVFDLRRQQFYVSNINGHPTEDDADGYISTLSPDGQLLEQHWLTGLNAPKGMIQINDRLYVADINELVEIDLLSKKIIQRYVAPEAKFLNDVAADNKGNVYVSGFLTNSIYRLSQGKFELWLQSEQLEVPNGLLVENNQLIVGSWGKMTDGFATAVPGHIKTIDIATKKITSLGDKSPAGNLDGIEPDNEGNYFVTDWMQGKLLHITPSGISTTLIVLGQGSADHTVVNKQDILNGQHNLVVIPMMNSNYVTAYKIKESP